MNERIVKLFIQSVDSKYIPLPVEDHIPSWTEKFAELIVGECIRKIEDIAESSNDPQPIYRVAVELLEHFGVEE